MGGFAFPSKDFSDVQNKDWSVCFTLWKFEPGHKDGHTITLQLMKKDGDAIINVGEIECTPAKSKNLLNAHLALPRRKKNDIWTACLPLTSAISKAEDGKKAETPANVVVFLVSGTSLIQQNAQQNYLISSRRPEGSSCYPIVMRSTSMADAEHLLRACAAFFVRRAILPKKSELWKVWHYSYLKPTVESSKKNEYDQWRINTLVYAMFNQKSSQSSLRNVKHAEVVGGEVKEFSVVNKFFFVSHADMLKLARDLPFKKMREDAERAECEGDSLVFQFLQQNLNKLYPEARDLLTYMQTLCKSKELLELRKEQQEDMDDEQHPLFLYCWDAGYMQLSKLFNATQKSEIKIKREKLRRKLYGGIAEYKFLKIVPEMEDFEEEEEEAEAEAEAEADPVAEEEG